jgi:hypothetical protein
MIYKALTELMFLKINNVLLFFISLTPVQLYSQMGLGIEANVSTIDTTISYGGVGPSLGLELPLFEWCAFTFQVSYLAQIPRADHARYCALIRPTGGLRVGPVKWVPNVAFEFGFSVITTQFYSRPVEILPGVEFPKTYSHWTNNYWYYAAHYHFKEKWTASVSYTYPVSLDFEIPYRQPMLLFGVRYKWIDIKPLFHKGDGG